MIEKIETFYSPGDTTYLEDGIIIAPPFYGVLDGYSTAYAGEPPLYEGLTDGQIVCKTILKTFHSLLPETILEKAILTANKEIAETKNEINEKSSAGAAFCILKIEEKNIKMIRGADCLALWVKKSGEIEISKNQHKRPTLEEERIFQKLMKEHQDKEKAWKEYAPILEARRKEVANKEFAVLDGQKQIKSLWEETEFSIAELELLICFSDGFIIPGKKDDDLAQCMIEFLKTGGLPEILQEVRKNEKKQAELSHKNYGEASAIVLTF